MSELKPLVGYQPLSEADITNLIGTAIALADGDEAEDTEFGRLARIVEAEVLKRVQAALNG